MTFTVWCQIEECPFEKREFPDLDTIFDVQEDHQDEYGEHHMLEFERNEE